MAREATLTSAAGASLSAGETVSSSRDQRWGDVARYEDLGPLGQGGMGEVRRVRDRRTDAILAMKIQLYGIEESVARQRFLDEARLTAQLQHPAIVAVQDVGELPDGRLWFTMEEVVGETLGTLIHSLHALTTPNAWGRPPSGWTLRRLVDAFGRICSAVGYAHARGVLHRDLKPSNLMIGAYGEVRVMDWGIARLCGQPEGGRALTLGGGTQLGQLIGTPGWMSPEQARGAHDTLTPASDVFSLGAILFMLLTGREPFGHGRAALRALEHGVPSVLAPGAHPPPPPELGAIVTQAMALPPDARFVDANALAARVQDWLDGTRRAEDAEQMVVQARALESDINRLIQVSYRLEREAEAAMVGVRPDDPIERKQVVWELQDAAQAARAEVRTAELEVERLLGAARLAWPDGMEAQDALADHLRWRLERAEQQGDSEVSHELSLRLRAVDRGRHATFLRGDGEVHLYTEPAGARAQLYRWELRQRRLVPVWERELGLTPLRATLPRGRWLVILEAPHHVPVRYPIFLMRGEVWDGIAPGDITPTVITLPRVGEVDPEDVFIPAGWCLVGDPQAPDGLPRRRLWIDAFHMRRNPVTIQEYLDFLRDCDPAQREALRPRHIDGSLPLRWSGSAPTTAAALDPPMNGQVPITHINIACVTAFIAWVQARTGLRWRLPHDLEWEKSARGVDGRLFPWGDFLDPTWCRMVQSDRAGVSVVPIDAYPTDESPYGVRGLAGNVRDWCANAYQRLSLPAETLRLQPQVAVFDEPLRMVRGGSWSSNPEYCRLGSRFVWRSQEGHSGLGFRLVR